MTFRFLKRIFGLFGGDETQDAPTSGNLPAGAPESLRVNSIQEFYDTLEYRFVPDAAKNADLVFQYNMEGADPEAFYIHVKDGTLTKAVGKAPSPTAGIIVQGDDYIQMINGDLNPRMAYLKGKMKLAGKKMAAQKLQKMILLGKDAEKHYRTLASSGKLAGIVTRVQDASGQDGSEVAHTPAALQASLTAPYQLKYTYQRTTGPVIGRFFTDLRDGRLTGVKTKDGRVIVPPTEYDPQTSEPVEDFVELSGSGTVRTWTWIDEPLPKHPLDHPFAFALIQLDGADTSMLHALDTGSKDAVSTGMRVQVRWAESRSGSMHDIACFVPEEAA